MEATRCRDYNGDKVQQIFASRSRILISSWHQEERDVCLLLSRRHRKTCRYHPSLASIRTISRTSGFREACDSLIASHELRSSFRVPDAAGDIEVTANLERRSDFLLHETQCARRQKETQRENKLAPSNNCETPMTISEAPPTTKSSFGPYGPGKSAKDSGVPIGRSEEYTPIALEIGRPGATLTGLRRW